MRKACGRREPDIADDGRPTSFRAPVRAAAAVLCLAALGFGGCAQQPQQLAAGHPKEYFPASVYGHASRRVIENGPVPHGGGQYLVGKPYTVAGQTYYPSERKITQVGYASWYGDAFHGRLTANGEIYDRHSFTAAHPTMPLPSYARVTNLRNGSSMIVRVNDRGPFASNRVMDVSRRVAEALDFQRTGTAKVKVEYIGHASLAGSDDAKLYATLRTNGQPAQLQEQPTLVAEAPPRARVASLDPAMPVPVRAIPLERPQPVERRPVEPPIAREPEVRERTVEHDRPIEAAPIERPRRVVEIRHPTEPRRWEAPEEKEPVPPPHPRFAAREEDKPVLRWQRGPDGKAASAHVAPSREAWSSERPERSRAESMPLPPSLMRAPTRTAGTHATLHAEPSWDRAKIAQTLRHPSDPHLRRSHDDD